MKHFTQTEEATMRELSEQELEQVMGACDCNNNSCCNCCGDRGFGWDNNCDREFGFNGFFGNGFGNGFN